MTTLTSIDNQGFYLTNLLNPDKCRELITKVETLALTPIQTSENYRKMDHVIFEDAELASQIWALVKEYVPSALTINNDNINIFSPSFCVEGDWQVIGLNPMWRCGRYSKDGLFAPHRDGFYAPTLDKRSFFTFMIYLNEDFEGGNTKFLVDKLCDVTEEKELKIQQGMAIIFPHNLLHEGMIVSDGYKYILRSDIMYQNVNSLNDNCIKAHELSKLATQIEPTDPKIAVSLYRQAIKTCPEIEKYL